MWPLSKTMTRLIGIVCVFTLAVSLLGSVALIVDDARMTRGSAGALPQPNLAPRPENILGVNVHLLGASLDEQEASLDDIQAAGFVWIRQVFDWSLLQPAPSAFEWHNADALVAAAAKRNLGVVAVLTNSPGWARPEALDASVTAPPDDPQTFASFAAAFATRYGKLMDVYQVWDEPNLQAGWGNKYPSATEYRRLLEPAYNAIHASDTGATVMLAGLAPNTETGPQNISDILFLRQLYDAGGQPYFDAAAGKPYGFDVSHENRTTDRNVLNFSRFILLREEMERAGDGMKLLWASNFGWYNDSAAVSPSKIWGNVPVDRQKNYTLGAHDRARREWPWSGVLVLENYQPPGPPEDPRWGFALMSPDGEASLLMTGLTDRAEEVSLLAAPSGVHPADSQYAQYFGDWEFSELGADIPQSGVAEIVFTFVGTDFGIIARRDNYRAYLYVEIDGKPANGLPRDLNGEAYQVLTSTDLAPHVELLPMASSLHPGVHTARLRAERGWGQWAVVGYSTASIQDRTDLRLSLTALVTLGLLSLVGLLYSRRRLGTGLGTTWLNIALSDISTRTQTLVAVGLAALFWISTWMVWGHQLTQLFRRNGDALPVAFTALSAGMFYFSPWLLIALASIIALFLLFQVRPGIALALIAFSAPFYMHPRPLFERVFSTVEVFTLVAAVSVCLNVASNYRGRTPAIKFDLSRLTSLDIAVAAFTLLSALSLLTADLRRVALTEFRVIVVEPALLYLMLRILPLSTKDIWRIVDFFVLGATLVAAIGLYQYYVGINLVSAEAGVMRLRSVYGSPNNVGLYLGRALPVAAAVVMMGRYRVRRRWYMAAVMTMTAALILSFSRGALLLGIPVALATLILFWGGRRAVAVLSRLGVLVLLTLFALSGNPRVAELVNVSTGPTFFRINLWRSTLNMIRDVPMTGVGLDNFLYAYRGGYIAPAAWEEPNLSHAHNWVLDLAARLGLPGLAVGLWILAAFFQIGARVRRHIGDHDLRVLMAGLLASMVDFLAHGMVDASYWFVDLAFVFMMTLGLVARLDAMVQSEIDMG